MVALCVVGMGDDNAVDFSHEVHVQLLKDFGLCHDATQLRYGKPLPKPGLLEGVYIDDHLVLLKASKAELRLPSGPDSDAIEASHAAYASVGLPRAPQKGFGFSRQSQNDPCGEENFTAWGTEVRSEDGTAAAPVRMRAELFCLACSALSLPAVGKNLLRRLVGNFVIPFLHRRECTSTFHRVYKFMSELEIGEVVSWPSDIRDEIALAALLLPLAASHMRWPISETVTLTDASPSAGGAVSCRVLESLSEALYDACEQNGEHVRMDDPFRDAAHMSSMPPPAPEIDSIVKCLPWEAASCHEFKRSSHVNIQGLQEIRKVVVDRSQQTSDAKGLVNGSDPRVAIGCWGQARSSPYLLNGVLRATLGWLVYARRSLANFWVCSGSNVADDPSRFKPVRVPEVPPAWLESHIAQVAAAD